MTHDDIANHCVETRAEPATGDDRSLDSNGVEVKTLKGPNEREGARRGSYRPHGGVDCTSCTSSRGGVNEHHL